MPKVKRGGTGRELLTTRRTFLKRAGASAAAVGLASAGFGPFVQRGALAADKTLKILQWSHFVPAYDTWFDKFAGDWGNAHGIEVTVDHIPHLEIPARSAAEVAAQSGHDLFGFNGAGGPILYRRHTVDTSSLVHEIEKKFGKVSAAGRGVAYDVETKTWPAYPDYYVRLPGLYRKDLWDEIGMTPDTWDDVRVGGAKLRVKGHPVGISLAHSVDPSTSWRAVMFSYGGAIADATGKHNVIKSRENLEAIKFVRALYKEAMDNEVLSWDDASNNQFLQSGRGCWIHNPISAYRSTQQTNPELANHIWPWKTPAGPVRRLTAASPNSYVIWKFAQNIEGAKAFLEHYAEHWKEGFIASTGYNHPVFEHIVPEPMPILSDDPSSHPHDKLEVLETANDWSCIYGWPGPGTPAAAEVANNYTINDMMANAALDRMTPEEALDWANRQIQPVFDKWNRA